MREIFFDRPGVLFSDGTIVKFSLQSFQPAQRGEVLEDVALLVCKPESVPVLVEILSDYIASAQSRLAANANKQLGPSIKNHEVSETDEPEEKLRLSTMRTAHT